jgi:hypothetical protein
MAETISEFNEITNSIAERQEEKKLNPDLGHPLNSLKMAMKDEESRRREIQRIT